MTKTTRVHGPMLHPRVTVLVRPSGVVQLGWDPERALLLHPGELDADTVLAFLRLLNGSQTRPQLIWRAEEYGIASERALALLMEIDGAGLLMHPNDPTGRIRSVRVHGLGPLADAVSAGLPGLGLRPSRSRGYGPDTTVAGWRTDLVILTDSLITDPRLANDLVLHRMPHLQVRIRDDRGVVGPLVVPGVTSCLRCADLIRYEHDADWPLLAAQLLGRVGHASPAGIAATTALVLGELEAIIARVPERPPATFGTTLELDLASHLIERRDWPPHAACGCQEISAGPQA
ncbi:hypothetical protein [Nocardia australiensis]|uniref:hypothetical protein n=1 Tax=Nocardia australiensis TaxID=2887191 RepID=UPI001D14A66E|nr:hypothetical protein [Nocardia australiensis]